MNTPQINEFVPVPTDPKEAYTREFEFPNGYTANVVRRPGSYGWTQGLFEVAIFSTKDGELVTDLPDPAFERGVIGWLTPIAVAEIVNKVAQLEDRA